MNKNYMLNLMFYEYMLSRGLNIKNFSNNDYINDIESWLVKYDAAGKFFVDFLIYTNMISFKDKIIEVGKSGISSVAPYLQRCSINTEVLTLLPLSFDIYKNVSLNINNGCINNNGYVDNDNYAYDPSDFDNTKIFTHNFNFDNPMGFSYQGIIELIRNDVSVVLGQYHSTEDFHDSKKLLEIKELLEDFSGRSLLYQTTQKDDMNIQAIAYLPKKRVLK